MKITGTVVHVALSGGFWGIEADNGEKYQPTGGLPTKFQKNGLKVKAEVKPSYDFTIFMWGKSVNVVRIEKL